LECLMRKWMHLDKKAGCSHGYDCGCPKRRGNNYGNRKIRRAMKQLVRLGKFED
jgi:hypothetical protein